MQSKRQKIFLELYEPVHERFERFCRARVYGEMDYKDLINETLLVAFQKFETLEDQKYFLSYLFSISVKLLANSSRKKKAKVYNDKEFIEVKDINADTEKNINIYLLHHALALLPEVQKECVILFEITGFSIKEIMKIQNSSESAIKQRLKRGRERLRSILVFESEYKVGEVEQ